MLPGYLSKVNEQQAPNCIGIATVVAVSILCPKMTEGSPERPRSGPLNFITRQKGSCAKSS